MLVRFRPLKVAAQFFKVTLKKTHPFCIQEIVFGLLTYYNHGNRIK